MTFSHSSATGWSPDKNLWEKLGELGSELSWKKVTFELSRRHLLPEKKRGVYMIGAAPPIKSMGIVGAYTILYAGQVKSGRRGLRDRFLEHIKRPSAQLKIFIDCYYPTIHFW